MNTSEPFHELLVDRLKAEGVLPLNHNGVRRLAAAVLAISPPFVCALLAERTGRWDLSERSGQNDPARAGRELGQQRAGSTEAYNV